jgi:hypothetical protein
MSPWEIKSSCFMTILYNNNSNKILLETGNIGQIFGMLTSLNANWSRVIFSKSQMVFSSP